VLVRRALTALFVTALLLGLVGTIPGNPANAADPQSHVRAGVGVADATWNVGSGAGQYASDRNLAGELNGDAPFDPNLNSVKNEPSWGVQSRLSIRALVVEGNNGQRVALVKADNYLAQDHLQRRIEQLLDPALGITRHNIVFSATHDHSSPYDLTPSAGVWAFEDAFNLRMFEYEARQGAKAITQAATSLKPVRMGATTVTHNIFKGNIVGPSRGDDGTPAGYPAKFGDLGLTVLRFDDVTDPDAPAPLATWVNWGQHPESLDSYNLITADYLSALQRDVERATGSTMLFAQGDVGSSEGPYDDTAFPERLPDGVWRKWAHMGFAQMERGASYLANDVVKAWRQIGDGDPGVLVPFSTDFPVGVAENWVPGPVSHPYPSVSNCRTQTTAGGLLGIPVIGLPDCDRGRVPAGPDFFIYESLTSAGVPVPEHYDAPSFKGVEENMRIHLQAVRLGDVLLASCSCEAQVDLILNLESRTNDQTGDIWDGYPWDQFCDPIGDGATYACENPGTENPADRSLTIPKAAFDRMKAEIHNDAKGWDDPANAATAGSEPVDPAQIKGNFTKQEIQELGTGGYKLSVGLGHTGDYDGYTVSYREYMNRDSYRKALTSYGPHTADYMVTRLVRMAAALQGGPSVLPEPLDAMAQADEARQQAESIAMGQASNAAYEGWHASLPDDKGPAAVVAEPADIERFNAATFTWVGGSNAIDNPMVTVEQRQADGTWATFADQSGEVQTFLALPHGVTSVADARTGSLQWKWTANFEAFDPYPTHAARQVPDGTYRFVVDGAIRQGGGNTAYHLASREFTVSPWTGITVTDVRAEPDGRASVAVAPVAYPRTYASTAASRIIKDDGRTGNRLCKTCSFRPWASTGEVASVQVTAVSSSGARTLDAALDPATGRWTTTGPVYLDETASVASGGVRDGFGEVNGAASESVAGTAPRPVGPGLPQSDGGSTGLGTAGSKSGGRGHGRPVLPIGWMSAGAGVLLILLLIGALFAGVGGGVRRVERRG
jgi:hypothetical protein